MRAVIVAAVSTEAQAADERASIPDQLALCRRACADHSWQIVREIEIRGHSRDYLWLDELLEDCPEYGELVDLMRGEQVDVIVCRHYDRLWRTSFLQAQVGALCAQHRVQIYSVLQPQAPVEPERLHRRRGLSGIMELLSGALSEEEQRLRIERAQAGVKRRIAEGKPGCWTTPPTGYRLVDGALVVDEKWAAIVRWIYEQRAEGKGGYSIMMALNERGISSPRGKEWSEATISRILRNDTYVGAVSAGDYHNPNGNHEPIIEDDLWQRVQAVNDQRFLRVRSRYALSGLARCGYCDWGMVYTSTRASLRMRCSHYVSTGGRACRCNSHAAHLIEEPVLQAVQEALRDRESWAEAQQKRLESDGTVQELAMLRQQREDARAQRTRLLDAYQIGTLPRDDLERRSAEVADRLETLEARITELSVTQHQIEAFCATLGQMDGLVNELPTMPEEALRDVYAQLIDHVSVTAEDLVIHWRV